MTDKLLNNEPDQIYPIAQALLSRTDRWHLFMGAETVLTLLKKTEKYSCGDPLR
jgi:hypothetical protein